MAKRFYFSNTGPTYTPATVRGAWNLASGYVDNRLGCKNGVTTTININETSTTNNYDVLLGRFISDPLKGITVPTSGTVKWSFGAKENSTSANSATHIHIFVLAGDSDTVRGTLLTDSINDTTEWPTTAASRYYSQSIGSEVVIQDGDRLVVEIGYINTNTSATSYGGTMNYGGEDATDLNAADADTAVTTRPGWIEFSSNISLVKIEKIYDTFDDNSLDTSKFSFNQGSVATIAETNEGIEITTSSTQYDSASISSKVNFSLISSCVSVQIKDAGGSSDSGRNITFSPLTIASTQVNGTENKIYAYINSNWLGCNDVVNGTYDAKLGGVTYDPDVHKYVRFWEGGGTVYFDYSTDGLHWVNIGSSSAIAIDFGDVWFSSWANAEGTGQTATICKLNNLNVSPIVTGFGVNYESITNADADITYFNSVGVNIVRINIPWPNTSDFTDCLALSSKFYDAGFYVIFGCTQSISATYTWATYITEAKAAAAAAVGKCNEFNIGNELELNNDDGYITDSALRENLRVLATEIQGIFPDVVSYVTESGTSGDTNGSYQWSVEGKGDLDKIGLNTYGWADNPFTVFNPEGYYTYIPDFFKAFGVNGYISEFNLDSDAANFAGIPNSTKDLEVAIMLAYIRNWSVGVYCLYQYRGNKDLNNDFAVKLMNNSWLSMWDVLLNFDASDYINDKLYFDGNYNNTVILPFDPTILEIGASSDYSAGAKVYLKPKTGGAEGGDNHTIANCDFNYGGNTGCLFQVDNSSGSIQFWSGNTLYYSDEGLVPYFKECWVMFTLTGTTLKAYVDGTLVWTQTRARVATGGGSKWEKIFGAESTGFRELYGYAKEFFAVKSLLSATDITNLIDGTWPSVGVRYKCDEGISYAAIDYSGNENTGLIYEAVWEEPYIPPVNFNGGRLISIITT